MKDITLVTVNWNNQPCAELLLKSYVKHHYVGEPLKILLADNGSNDGSKEWFLKNNIPFISFNENLSHEPALNIIYPLVKTKYCLLNDTDLEYTGNVFEYLDTMDEALISVGEYINWDCYHDEKIMPRISPWFWLFNIQALKMRAINKWREGDNWRYDVGSWLWEQMEVNGFKNLNIPRYEGDQDKDLISMVYPRYRHWGKTSWDISKHVDRIDEVTRRREAIKERLKDYNDIDLTNKFAIW